MSCPLTFYAAYIHNAKIYWCLSANYILSIFFESADFSADSDDFFCWFVSWSPFSSSSQASSNQDLYLQSILALVSSQSHNLILKMRLSWDWLETKFFQHAKSPDFITFLDFSSVSSSVKIHETLLRLTWDCLITMSTLKSFYRIRHLLLS